MKPRFLLKQGFMYNKVKSKPYKDICIFLVAHKLKWKGIEPEVHNPYIPISYLTLSKILCKWKQDSVVSLFLYLDSVFKNKHKLVHNQAPV